MNVIDELLTDRQAVKRRKKMISRSFVVLFVYYLAFCCEFECVFKRQIDEKNTRKE